MKHMAAALNFNTAYANTGSSLAGTAGRRPIACPKADITTDTAAPQHADRVLVAEVSAWRSTVTIAIGRQEQGGKGCG